MVEQKQTLTVEHLQCYAIRDFKVKNTKITLIRGDGEEFVLNTAGIVGGKGESGEKGDKGLQGESAYDIAVRYGTTDSVEQWLKSLKGEQGLRGITGKDGQRGADGKDSRIQNIVFNPTVWLTAKEDPDIIVKQDENDDLVLTLMLPAGEQGEAGEDSRKTDLSTGQCISAKDADINIVNNKLNVTLPRGITGDPGKDSVGQNAVAPVIDLSVVWTDEDKTPVIAYDGEPVLNRSWTKKITAFVPRGLTGKRGLRGQQGEDRPLKAEAIMKIITDEDEIQDPGKGFCCIAIDNLKGFQGKAYGYSWRTKDITFQVVRFVNTTNGFYTGWYYRRGPAEGNISEGITEGWKRCTFR